MYSLIVVGCFIGICLAENYLQTYDMEYSCDEELSFIWKDLYQTRVRYTYRPSAPPGSCTYTVESWYSQDRLMFYFENLYLDCSEGTLKISDGEYDSSITGLEYDICGTKPSGTYVSYNRQVKLIFTPRVASSYISNKVYFNIVFTSFHIGSCASYEYECDNGRCIDDDLSCNGFNPCGDNSDCRMSGWVIAGIVIGCICVVGGIIFIAVLVYMCKRKRPVRNPWPATSTAAGQQQPLTTPGTVAYQPAPYPQVAVQYQYPPGQAPQPYVQYQQPGYGQYPQPVTAPTAPTAPPPNQSAMPPPAYSDAVNMPKTRDNPADIPM